MEKFVKNVNTVSQIKEVIEETVIKSKTHESVREHVDFFKKDTPYQVCEFLDYMLRRGDMKEIDEPANEQWITMPDRMFLTKTADVKSWCVFFGAVLNGLAIPWYFRLHAFSNNQSYMFLVVETEKGEVYLHTDPTVKFNDKSLPRYSSFV